MQRPLLPNVAPVHTVPRRSGGRWLLLALLLLTWWWLRPAPMQRGAWQAQRAALRSGHAVAQAPMPATPAAPPGEHALVGPATVTAAQIDAVLAQYDSPAIGTGTQWVALGQQYGLDPAYALAFFIHESSAGTASQWAGLKGGGQTTHNIGNIICAGYATCFNGFRDYPDWQTGIADWYRLIRDEYVQGRGLTTLEQILPIYCPVGDGCAPDAYRVLVHDMVRGWQGQP